MSAPSPAKITEFVIDLTKYTKPFVSQGTNATMIFAASRYKMNMKMGRDVVVFNEKIVDELHKAGASLSAGTPTVLKLTLKNPADPVQAYLGLISEMKALSALTKSATLARKALFVHLEGNGLIESQTRDVVASVEAFSASSAMNEDDITAVVKAFNENPKLLAYCALNFKRGKMFEIYDEVGYVAITKMLMKLDQSKMDYSDSVTAKSKSAADLELMQSKIEKHERRMKFLRGDIETLKTEEKEVAKLWPLSKKTFKIAGAALEKIGVDGVYTALSADTARVWKLNGRVCVMSGYALGVLIAKGLTMNTTAGHLVPESDLIKVWRQLITPNSKSLLAQFVVSSKKEWIVHKTGAFDAATSTLNEEVRVWWCVLAEWTQRRNAQLKMDQRTKVSTPASLPYSVVATEIANTSSFKF